MRRTSCTGPPTRGYTGDSNFYEVNKATGELTFLADVEYNGAMVGLFKPWQPESGLFPQDTELTGLKLSRDVLMMWGRTEKADLQASALLRQAG